MKNKDLDTNLEIGFCSNFLMQDFQSNNNSNIMI